MIQMTEFDKALAIETGIIVDPDDSALSDEQWLKRFAAALPPGHPLIQEHVNALVGLALEAAGIPPGSSLRPSLVEAVIHESLPKWRQGIFP